MVKANHEQTKTATCDVTSVSTGSVPAVYMPQFFKLKIANRTAPHPDTQPIDAFNIMPGQITILPIYQQPRVGSGGLLSILFRKYHGHDEDAKCGVYQGGVLLVKHQICPVLQA